MTDSPELLARLHDAIDAAPALAAILSDNGFTDIAQTVILLAAGAKAGNPKVASPMPTCTAQPVAVVAPAPTPPALTLRLRVKPEAYTRRYDELSAEYHAATDPAEKAALKVRVDDMRRKQTAAILQATNELYARP